MIYHILCALLLGVCSAGVSIFAEENNEQVVLEQVTGKITITKKELEDAINNIETQKAQLIKFMVNDYKAMSKKDRQQVIHYLKRQVQSGQGEEGVENIALNALGWYLQFCQNDQNQEKKIFKDEKERKKFERAIFQGNIIGINEEKGFVVVRIGDEILIFYSNPECAMQLVSEKILPAFEGKKTEEVTQEFVASLFEKCLTELKEKFLYDMLFLHLFTKVTKSWVPDIFAALKKI